MIRSPDQPRFGGQVQTGSQKERVLQGILADPPPDFVGIAHGRIYGVVISSPRGGCDLKCNHLGAIQ